MAMKSLRRIIITAITARTANNAGSPFFATTGRMMAATTEPGSASSMRCTRAVIGTWPIIQKPPTRTR